MRKTSETTCGSERAPIARRLLAAADVVKAAAAVKRWSWNRTRALLLALVLGAAMSVTLVQGGLMAAEMTIGAESCAPSGCDGCDGGAAIDTCLSVCGSTAHGLLPVEPVALLSASRADFRTECLVPGGRTKIPDHGPPKISTLG
jgi:hypothetical protein